MPHFQGNDTVSTGFFGRRLVEHLSMPGGQILGLEQRGGLALAVTQLSCPRTERERTAPIPSEAAFSILHQRSDLQRHACWLGGKQRYCDSFSAGTVSVIDLRDAPQWEFTGPLEALQFYVPRRALDDFAHEHRAPAIETLKWRHDIPDATVSSLSSLLLSALDQPAGSNDLVLDHLSLSLLSHFAQSYGGLRTPRASAEGRLAPWQERRAKEIMRARLASQITIADIASECRLTPSHFARAFRRSTGRAPHQYLSDLRVEEAKRLLLGSPLPLADIALICGFGDQSYFTRVFSRLVGTSPGAWRRAVRD
jgi:AraC family transcriptional regulator